MRSPSTTLTLFAILLVCWAFALGLTWAPCYSQVCPERYHPLATRMHIVAYYALLASIVFLLLLRATSAACRAASQRRLTTRELPLLRDRITAGGLALAMWITGIALATTAFWVGPLLGYWTAKCVTTGWASEVPKLVVTGVFAHHADILLGLLLIPVGRNSLLMRAFQLHQHNLLYAHKMLAYAMVLMAVIHGATYYTFFAAWIAVSWSQAEKKITIDLENPNITFTDLAHLDIYYSVSLFTGTLSFALALVIVATSLPITRRKAYNTFYYMHLMLSSLVFIGTCIHASTNFYFLLPGLLLWGYDWCWRLFCGSTGSLRSVDGTIEHIGGGWVRIVLPPCDKTPAPTLPVRVEGEALNEQETGWHPLQTFWISIPCISRLQNHAFNVATAGTPNSGPTILCQPTSVHGKAERRKDRTMKKQWTWKVRSQTNKTHDDEAPGMQTVRMRVEGPYLCEDHGFEIADRVICLVGGTGVTGALSLAEWYLVHRMQRSKASFTIIWTLRNASTALLPEWQHLLLKSSETDGRMRLRTHVSSGSGRLNVAEAIGSELAGHGQVGGSAWLYLSGPADFLRAAEDACCDIEANIRRTRKMKTARTVAVDSLSYFAAKWEI